MGLCDSVKSVVFGMLSNGCLVGKVYLSPFKKFCFWEKYLNLQLESCSEGGTGNKGHSNFNNWKQLRALMDL